MSRTDNWLTPPEIIEALGPFDLDPCASLDQTWATAARQYTVHDNGLVLPWRGRVWLNPPYSRALPWIAKLALHGIGTALLFARTDTKLFFEHVFGRAMLLMFLRGRVKFIAPHKDHQRDHAPEASVLIAYGEQDADRLAESELDGHVQLVGNETRVVVAVPARTWGDIIADVFQRHGAELALEKVYALVSDHPKTLFNQHWKAKVRQQVQRAGFERVGPGIYRLRAA